MSNTEALAAADARNAPGAQPDADTFQERSRTHMLAIAKDDPTDVPERRDRFHEEALEVAHRLGTSREDAHRLVDYVWDRPAGDLRQEIGQALKTLADLASETGHDMMACGEEELARTWQPGVFAKIQRKRAARHGRGPLPGVDGQAVAVAAPSLHASLNEIAAACHAANAKWWQDPATGQRIPRNKGELLMLIVSEIAEAMEGERKDLMDDKLPHRRMAEVELADALIRIFDYAGAFGYDLDGAVTEKLAFNATRADHTHEARLRAGGKKW